MEFKFKKGDTVRITYGSTFGGVPCISDEVRVITDRKSSSENIHNYKLKGLKGWWSESLLRPMGSKNSLSRDESSVAAKDQGHDSKRDTDENRAFWLFDIPGYAKCSSCGRSFEALPTKFMFKENNKFCRMCGKAMEVRDED